MHFKELGIAVKWHRKQAKLSQMALARHAGVSRFVVQDIEKGHGRTSWSNLEKVLRVLNIRLEPTGPLVDAWRSQSVEAQGEEAKP